MAHLRIDGPMVLLTTCLKKKIKLQFFKFFQIKGNVAKVCHESNCSAEDASKLLILVEHVAVYV